MKTTLSTRRSYAPRTLALAVVAALCATSAFVAADAAAVAGSVSVAQTTRLQSGDRVIGALPLTQPIHISVALKMRDRAGLESFVTSMAKSQKQGAATRPMTSDEFMATHAPTQAQAQVVADYLASRGFTNIQIAPNRMTVTATGTAQTARDAFMTTFAQVKTADGRIAYANVDEVRVPAALSDKVRAVLGLQTVHKMHTFAQRMAGPPHLMGSAHTLAFFNHFPDEYPLIYGVGSAAAATDIPVGIVVQGNLGQTRTDLATFASNRGFSPVVTTTVLTDGSCTPASSTSCTSGTDEWDLDSQDIVGMSGGVSELIFYNIPALFDNNIHDDFATIVAANKVKITNVSLGGCETDSQGDGEAAADDDTFAIGIAQGQTFSISTGDSGADECGDGGTTPSWPAASEYVIAAAGTKLSTNSSNDAWLAETVWNSGTSGTPPKRHATGGSPSKFEPQPSWQTPFIPSSNPTTFRAVADIAYNADPNTGSAVYVDGNLVAIGGTSLSAPLFAGAWARMLHKYPTIGFAGPVVYALPAAAFHDVTSGNNTGETAASGFDYASGRGSMIVGTAITDAATLGNQPPVANFSYTRTGMTVNFTDTSTFTSIDSNSGIASYAWNFGDGGTSTSANPTHAYTVSGTYHIHEVVKDTVGAVGSKVGTITVAPIQVMHNGGFENGTPAPWTLVPAGILTNNASLAHSGSWFGALGGGSGAHTDNAWQTVTIPSGVTTATLSFYLNDFSSDTGSIAHDTLSVKVLNATTNATLATLATYSNLDATSGYVQENLDMTPYIGQTVKLNFSGVNDATLPTTWYIDDVTLNGN